MENTNNYWFLCFSFKKRNLKKAARKFNRFCIHYLPKMMRKPAKSNKEKYFSHQFAAKHLANLSKNKKQPKIQHMGVYAFSPSFVNNHNMGKCFIYCDKFHCFDQSATLWLLLEGAGTFNFHFQSFFAQKRSMR